MNEIKRIPQFGTESTSQLSKNRTPIEIYDQYSAVAYGIILKIIPQAHIAQEVLVEVFASPLLKACNSYPFSFAVCIIKLARSKAIDAKRKIDALIPKIDGEIVEILVTPEVIFDLAFCQGYSPDEVAVKLNIPKSEVLKSIHMFFHSNSKKN